jgi:4,5-DOPA dioxygenase extradiol
MDRRRFLASLALIPLTGAAMKIDDLMSVAGSMESTGTKMPVLFVGHGNPMNAVEDNDFTRGWQAVARNIPVPKAILCISAHWETAGTFITAMPKPRTIHDFGGFPQDLYNVQYPAPGDPELARAISREVKKTQVLPDEKWGLDHGTWSVLTRMYPVADIPVLQLSLDYRKEAQYHYELASELAFLREKGILVVGSGNMVHNLRMVDWSGKTAGFDWAIEANDSFKRLILSGDHAALTDYTKQGKAVQLAVPTPEHYLPLLYVLALQGKQEEVSLFNDALVMGSLSMTSMIIGG